MLDARVDSTSVLLFGAGRVGTAIAHLLLQSGYSLVGVGPAGRASTGRAGRLLGAEAFKEGEIPAAGIVLLGVPDSAITQVAGDIASRLVPDALVVHFAGALGVGPLDSVRVSGANPVALHPVQSCPDVSTAVRRLPGSAWGVTCAPDVLPRAERIVADLGGSPVLVSEEDRVLWHAASATVANGTAALLGDGEAILAAIGIPEPSAVLGPLAAGVAANASELRGGASVLTGPVVRGDAATLKRHIEALRRRAPGLVDRYRQASLLALEAALDAARLDPSTAHEVRSVLEHK